MSPRIKYIRYKKSTKHGRTQKGWVVQYQGVTHSGYLDTKAEAIKILRRVLGLGPRAKLPVWGGRAWTTATARKIPPRLLWHRVKCLVKFFQARRSRAPSKVFGPADVEASLEHVSKSAVMYRSEPALHFISLGLKYAPCKNHLLKAWRTLRPKFRGRRQSVAARAQVLQKVLTATAGAITKSPVPNCWPTHVNRFRGREQGPHMVFKHLGITRRPLRKGPWVWFIEGQAEKKNARSTAWRVLPTAGSTRKLQRFIKAVDAVVASMGDAPKTCSDYCEKMRAARKALKPCKSPLINGSYLAVWYLRGYLLDLMHAARVPSLKMDGDLSVRSYATMNPDQKGCLQRLLMFFWKRQEPIRTVRQFLAKFGKCPPELLSMVCCLAVDVGFREDTFKPFRLASWCRAAESMHECIGIEPHVALVSQHLCDDEAGKVVLQ